jgi:predicted phage tail protein
VSAAGNTVTLDAPVNIASGGSHTLSCVIGEGTVETRTVYSVDATNTIVTLSAPFTSLPKPGVVWVFTSSNLKPTQWRVTSIREQGNLIYEVQAIKHNPAKWGYVERGDPIEDPVITNIKPFPDAPKDPKVREDLALISADLIGVHCTVSWTGNSYGYVLQWQRENGTVHAIETHDTSVAFDTDEGMHSFRLWAVNRIGNPSSVVTFQHNVIGKLAPPKCPTGFGLQIVSDIGLFTWDKTTDLDVAIGGRYELRYSPKTTGATWVGSTTLLPSIPGSATSVEVPYRAGTYLLRAVDSVGQLSDCIDGAQVISTFVSNTTARL